MSRGKNAKSWKHWLQLAINVALFAIALAVLRHILTQYKLADVIKSLHRIGRLDLAGSLLLTILGYAALVGYDYLSLRIARHPISVRRMWSASFISHAVQNSAPVSILAGGGVRYRLFKRLGVSGTETATVVAGNVLTFVIGLFAVAGLSFVIAPVAIPSSLHLPIHSLQPVGVIFLVIVIAALVLAQRGVASVKIGKWRLDVPTGKLLREQLGVSVADWLLSSAALYVLMIAAGPISYPRFLSGFLLAQIVTQVVPLPGGVGVFEAAILLLRPPGVDATVATAALLVYRVIYYLIPLFFATAILALEASHRKRTDSTPVRVARDVAPHLFAVLAFLAGVILLVFATIPGNSQDFQWLGHLLQLAVIEGSRFIGSLVGTALLLLAFGLERRLRSAFRLTVGVLLLGIPAAVLHSMDIVAAAVLIVLLLLLLLAHREFNRKIPFTAEPINAGWLAAALVAAGGVVWLGVVLQIHQDYSSRLWWRFAVDQDAPRTLRVGLGVLVVLVAFVVLRLVTRARRIQRIRRRSHASGRAAHARTPRRARARQP